MLHGTALLPLGMLDLNELVVKPLAVAGGALVGGLVVGLVVQLASRSIAPRGVPRWVLVLSRLLGAVAAGLAVYLWIYGAGGTGGMGGGGGGWWPFGQSGSGVGTTQRSTPNTNTAPPDTTPRKRPDTLEVIMRGGDAAEKDQRFWVLDGEGPQDWDGITRAIEERKRQQPELKVIEIVIEPNRSVAHDHPAVVRLMRWAEMHQFQSYTVQR
jgi:hypothetical protein